MDGVASPGVCRRARFAISVSVPESYRILCQLCAKPRERCTDFEQDNAMSLSGAYDDGNVFARILRKEIPAAVIYEDEHVLALLDAFPQTRGHALVISKTSKARNLLEIDARALGEVMAATQRVARAITTRLQPDGLVIKQFNGAAAGQTVFHLHVHIIPVWENQTPGEHVSGAADLDDLRTLAKDIAAGLD